MNLICLDAHFMSRQINIFSTQLLLILGMIFVFSIHLFKVKVDRD